MIDSMRKTFSAKELCEAFEVSPSSYYACKQTKRTKRLMKEEKIIEAIKDIHSHRHMKSYGSPRMTEELKSRGFQCGLAKCPDRAEEPRTAGCIHLLR